jgi:hypothetical protein
VKQVQATSREDAEQRALVGCTEYFAGEECRAIMVAPAGTCLAFAVDSRREITFWSRGFATEEEAAADAMSECGGGNSCGIQDQWCV